MNPKIFQAPASDVWFQSSFPSLMVHSQGGNPATPVPKSSMGTAELDENSTLASAHTAPCPCHLHSAVKELRVLLIKTFQ